MELRIIQMINNFYKDQMESDDDKSCLGEYCAFGYFDALHIGDPIEYISNNSIWKCFSELTIKEFSGDNSRRVLPCLIENKNNADEKFWNKAKTLPFLFISMIRTKRNNSIEAWINNKIEKVNRDAESKKPSIAYLTNNHSEIVVIHADNSYIEGMKYLRELNENDNVLKKYTIFAAQEDALDIDGELYKSIESDKIRCHLEGVVKNWKNINEFRSELSNELKMDEKKICTGNILGSKDILIEIPEVNIKDIIRLYKMGNLLTHSNKRYFCKTFYNLETKFFVDLGEKND